MKDALSESVCFLLHTYKKERVFWNKGKVTEATRNKCHASSNKCLTSSNKKLLVTSATLVVTILLSSILPFLPVCGWYGTSAVIGCFRPLDVLAWRPTARREFAPASEEKRQGKQIPNIENVKQFQKQKTSHVFIQFYTSI